MVFDFLLMAQMAIALQPMTVDEAKAKHHAYIQCLKHESVRVCNRKFKVIS